MPVKHLPLLIPAVLFPFMIGIFISEPGKLSPPDSVFNSAAYPEHLVGPYTGGFGEETCRSCHFDFPVNPENGDLVLKGIPEVYEQEKNYTIEIRVKRNDLGLAGFQFTSRFPDGSQAGNFKYEKDHITVTPDISDSVVYLQHAPGGTEPQQKNTKIWTFDWQAPKDTLNPVLFHVVSNAANGDASEFGDWIYAKEVEISPSGK